MNDLFILNILKSQLDDYEMFSTHINGRYLKLLDELVKLDESSLNTIKCYNVLITLLFSFLYRNELPDYLYHKCMNLCLKLFSMHYSEHKYINIETLFFVHFFESTYKYKTYKILKIQDKLVIDKSVKCNIDTLPINARYVSLYGYNLED